jgi:hypothetical protein
VVFGRGRGGGVAVEKKQTWDRGLDDLLFVRKTFYFARERFGKESPLFVVQFVRRGVHEVCLLLRRSKTFRLDGFALKMYHLFFSKAKETFSSASKTSPQHKEHYTTVKASCGG